MKNRTWRSIFAKEYKATGECTNVLVVLNGRSQRREQPMSDIDTDEEPEDVAEQLSLDEYLELQAEEEAEQAQEEPATPVESDIYERGLGAAISYVVYFSAPSATI
jgi:hypothetical protein